MAKHKEGFVWRVEINLAADPTDTVREGSLRQQSRYGATDEEQEAFAREHPGDWSRQCSRGGSGGRDGRGRCRGAI